MKLNIVIIGDEILLGRVTDTNSGLLARAFSECGWQVGAVRTVGDNADAIREAIEASLADSALVLTTGGLGPTRDDITKGVLMSVFGGKLIFDKAVEANVEAIFADRGIKINELTRTQALVPDSCRVIQNRYGTAPLMWFERDGRVLVSMPGVPFETRGMLQEVLDAVNQHFGKAELTPRREFTVTGISESALAEQLADFEDLLPAGYKLAYLPSPGEILLRLDGTPGSADFEEIAQKLMLALGGRLAGVGKLSPAEMLIHRLRTRGFSCATAESCTGGNIAHLITAVPGCSDVFRGGVVSYANELKMDVLGVSGEDIEREGAVSEPVVRQMAEGACRVCGADCAVATSGIAGPGGAVPGKPVGTVWIAAHVPGKTIAEMYHFSGDRQAVIDRASAQALRMLDNLLKD